MKVTKDNLIDTIDYYMQDNDLDYLHIRASLSANGEELIMVISDDIELEDEDE